MTAAAAPGRVSGTTAIDDRVFRVCAVRGALSVPGVIDHASGLNRLTGRRLPRADLRWDTRRESVVIDLQIAVAWPSPLVDVARRVRKTAARWVSDTTGMPVSAVNVDIAAVVPVPGPVARVTVADIDRAPEAPELAPVSSTPLVSTSPAVHRMLESPVVPGPPDRAPLTPVHAPRPAAPTHVPLPASPVLTPVQVSPRSTPVPVTVPAHRTPVGVPTPARPRLENVTTPRGLPVAAVPTPEGLDVSIFPSVERRGVMPVTVRRSPRIIPDVPAAARRDSTGRNDQ